ncbi:hypothetical protein CspeluHIS016_0102060 [Cutaneotrichosporon spelunceum]|uniref:Uncharacterized protein n=1 Tax=Cutaneotrichosporon spelunceum TaxID=1672016 RepID=A0AAD3TNN6_9TREE|nr:hypothetical protein CspeluHIS016_0102060 [Cutaneotrichosporon spelunceum]
MPARPRKATATGSRKAAKPPAVPEDLILPPHTVRTTFTMPGCEWDADAFHHAQQYCYHHHPGAHVEVGTLFPRIIEFHVTAPRSPALVPGVCANIADTLRRLIRYRVGNVLAIVKPLEVEKHTSLSVVVVQRAAGASELYRRVCACEECCSSVSGSEDEKAKAKVARTGPVQVDTVPQPVARVIYNLDQPFPPRQAVSDTKDQ